MAVKPYWWCPRCRAHHDLKPRRCVECGHEILRRGESRVASIGVPYRSMDLADIPPTYATHIAADATWAHDRHKAIAESGPGIAALALKAPPRARPPRHETKAWDPYGVSLPDAESGRYGWLS